MIKSLCCQCITLLTQVVKQDQSIDELNIEHFINYIIDEIEYILLISDIINNINEKDYDYFWN